MYKRQPLDRIVEAAIPFFKEKGLVDDAYLAAHKDYFAHLVDVDVYKRQPQKYHPVPWLRQFL